MNRSSAPIVPRISAQLIFFNVLPEDLEALRGPDQPETVLVARQLISPQSIRLAFLSCFFVFHQG